MAKNGLLRIMGISLSSSMARIMKSFGKMNISTLTRTFSMMPLKCLRDLSSSYKVIMVGLV